MNASVFTSGALSKINNSELRSLSLKVSIPNEPSDAEKHKLFCLGINFTKGGDYKLKATYIYFEQLSDLRCVKKIS